MDIKKLGIAGVLGFFAMALVGGLTFELFYKNHMIYDDQKMKFSF